MNPSKLPRHSFGDSMDKLSILIRKIYFGEEEASEDYNYICKALDASGINHKVITTVMRLTMINTEIWNLENDIRKGGEGKYSLEEIGRRAIKIRNLNRRRIRYKNKLNRIVSQDFTEVKVDHLSQ